MKQLLILVVAFITINGSNAQETEVDSALVNRSDYALLFATDTYDNWGKLVNPINDANSIATELSNVYGFDVEIITNPSKADIYQKLEEYAIRKFNEYDQLFIFFAAHGQYDQPSGQSYIVCKDSEVDEDSKASYLSYSDLGKIVDDIPIEHSLLTLDVVYGSFEPTAPVVRRKSGSPEGFSFTDFIRQKLSVKTRQYIASGGQEYIPGGAKGSHSPLTSKFLEAFASRGGRDRLITLTELYGWMGEIDPGPTAGSFGTNEPGSDFLFQVRIK